jgi:RES domain-containing protein
MRIWRISNHAGLSGMGGVRFSARWHSKGRPILYAAEHPAGALAEFLAHLDLEDIPTSFQLITIDVDGIPAAITIKPEDLAPDWAANRTTTRAAGDRWLQGGESLLLRVPSVLVPDAFNVLINPPHPDTIKMRIVKTEKVPLDRRFARG